MNNSFDIENFDPNVRVYGFIITFASLNDLKEFNRYYDDQWFLYETREERDKWYKKFAVEDALKWGKHEITMFNSKGKTYNQLVDWLNKTFIDCDEHIDVYEIKENDFEIN